MRSSGQAINIDYTIGMSLFLLAVFSGVLFVVDANLGDSAVSEARQKASLIQQELEQETYWGGRQSPLLVRTPSRTGKVPVDRTYVFHENAYPGSGSMDIPADISIDNERVVTVVDGSNTTHQLNYFYSNTTNLSYSNSIDTGSWMNNTQVSALPDSPGLQSLKVEGQEVLNPSADLNGNDFTVGEEELHAYTLSRDLKIYNGSRELILEDPGTVTFDMVNFTTLYWYSDNSTTELTGTGTFKSGNTTGFTVATHDGNDYGITFLGDELDATVSKPDSSTVRASIDSPRLRMYPHNSGYKEGKDRIEFYDQGLLSFGAEKKIRGASIEEIERLENLPERRFEEVINSGSFSYNLTYASLERGEDIPLETVVVSDRPSQMLGRYGNYSRIDNRVAVWR